MHPANHDLAAQVREQGIRQAVQQPISQASAPQVSRVRSLQSEESWIDVSSRNSTSSLSSLGGDETLTPSRGLGTSAFPRRRRLQRSYSGRTESSNATYLTNVADSSQEEYEESESEQDQTMSSSSDDVREAAPPDNAWPRRTLHRIPSSGSSSSPSMASSAEGTALNVGQQSESRMASSFRPQPNAFTHPPVPRQSNSYQPEPTSYFSATAPMARAASANAVPAHRPQQASSSPVSTPGPRTTTSSSSNATIRPRSHTPYNLIAPSHNISVDHDAALRASLSTLLSCAAARRGAPKRESPVQPVMAQDRQLTQGTLCLIPESDLDRATSTMPPGSSPVARTVPSEGTQICDNPPPATRAKSPRRKASAKSPSHSPNRKKDRNSYSGSSPYTQHASFDANSLSPTTLWFLGVGALFIGGAVLFTAGYIQGREIGYVEGLSDAGGALNNCRGDAAAADSLRGMGRRGWRSATAGASIWGIS